MFAYLRSHHKKGSQPSSPISSSAPDFRPGNRADWINSSQPTSSDGNMPPVSNTNYSRSPELLLSRLDEHGERTLGQRSYEDKGFARGDTQDTMHQAQLGAMIQCSLSMENIRPASSGHPHATHVRSGSYSRPSTSYIRPITYLATRSNTDDRLNKTAPRDKPTENSKSPQVFSAPQPLKPAKTKLNLLKPMSLLSRRKPGQSAEHSSEENLTCHKSLSVPAMKFPDDYDPSIRGKVVHDFSTPRARTKFSSTSTSAESYETKPVASLRSPKESEKMEKASRPRNSDRVHTPVFTEHFDDDGGRSREYQAAVQAECLADGKFISRNLPTDQNVAAKPAFEVGMLRGAFPARIDSSKPRSGAALKLVEELEASSDSTPPQEETSEASNSEFEERIASERHNSSTDRTSSIPSRWASKASRFSFQTGGSDSAAQERLLEERHQQKAAAQGLADALTSGLLLDENNDMDDMYDDMYDDGDYLEEQIPGVNAEIEDDHELFGGNLGSTGVAEMSLDKPQTAKESKSSLMYIKAQKDVQTMPEAADIQLINLNDHINRSAAAGQSQLTPHVETLYINQAKPPTAGLSSDENGVTGFSGLGLVSDYRSMVSKSADDDDLYFDDGEIEDINDFEKVDFNESILDDFERPVPGHKLDCPEIGEDATSQRTQSRQSADKSPQSMAVLPPRTTSLQVKANNQDTSGPMIDAYYSALADAANRAVAEGKFNGRDSLHASENYDTGVEGVVGEFVDGGNRNMISVGTEEMMSEAAFDFGSEMLGDNIAYYGKYAGMDYDYGRTADEDDIVAEANAEALANDDDGFYGQEFGFYAHALNASEEEQAANGGFFGPPGFDSLARSASGRNAVREPNLTPITERSEFSARNSYITLLNAGASPNNIATSEHLAASFATAPSSANHSSPNLSLTHPVHPYGFEEDDMTMSQLLRLRRGTFCGSSSSLKSGDTSGSGSGLGSANGAPAANPSPLSAEAGVSPFSLSNSDSSISPQTEPFYPDPRYQPIPRSDGTTATAQTTTLGLSERIGSSSSPDGVTHVMGRYSFAENHTSEDLCYGYSDDDEAALESPTLTGIKYPTTDPSVTSTSATTCAPPDLMNAFPTSPASPSSFTSQPQPLIPSTLCTNEMALPNPGSILNLPVEPIPITAESDLQQQQSLPTVRNPQTSFPADIHHQKISRDNTSFSPSSSSFHNNINHKDDNDDDNNTNNNNSNDSDKGNTDNNNKNNHEMDSNSNNDDVDKTIKKPFVRTHRRHGGGGSGSGSGSSSTDNISVAYVRERDLDGDDRWVLERRRTAEDGVMEIVGREVISKGWI